MSFTESHKKFQMETQRCRAYWTFNYYVDRNLHWAEEIWLNFSLFLFLMAPSSRFAPDHTILALPPLIRDCQPY